jgi:4,4'-diaponeurosporenoate glycosyltransferase
VTIFAIAYELAFLLTGVLLLWKIPRLDPGAEAKAEVGRLSVVIPARNEELVLPRLLETLRAQTAAPLEILVVDDGSTDATAEVARAGGARVLPAPPRPEAWVGKSWACWSGAQVAKGEQLLFLDADVSLEPSALEQLCSARSAREEMVTVQPYHAMRRVYERLSAVFNIVVMMGLNSFTVLGRRVRASGSYGPCLLVGRHEYFEAGGHRSVHADVIEDVALGRRWRDLGRRVSCYGGRGSVSFRMYPGGIRQLVQGWNKSMASGASGIRSLTFLLVVLWLCGCSGAVSHLCIGVVRGFAGGSWSYVIVAGSIYAAYAAAVGWMLRRIGRFGFSVALLFFIPLLFFHLVFLRSLVLTHVLRRVHWRGRTIRT